MNNSLKARQARRGSLSQKRQRTSSRRWHHKIRRTCAGGRPKDLRSVSDKMNTQIATTTSAGKRGIDLLGDPSPNKSIATTEPEKQAPGIAKPHPKRSEGAMRVVRGMSQSLCIVLLLLTCCTLLAQNEEHRVRNIVLVHGAWADGSGWTGVYDILVKDGYNVSIVQEPETSFKEDVAATKRVLALQDGPCILVGHSYGGAVITEAGTDPSVAGLVYIAAHMPDAGENEADDGKRFPSDLSKSGAIKKTADGFTYLDPA